jgi:chorismate synthase
MSWNTFGRVLRFTTWGESHGPALGAVVDGCPPGLALGESDIQPFLDRRRPGTSKFTTQRKEPDAVRILSGTFEGKTTGTPISLTIENVDQRSKDYSEVAKAYRPGHADYAYDAKYGFRDYRGGGRSSARETAARVAAGAVARLVIPEVTIEAYVVEIGGDAIDRAAMDMAEIGNNPFWCPDAEAEDLAARHLEAQTIQRHVGTAPPEADGKLLRQAFCADSVHLRTRRPLS